MKEFRKNKDGLFICEECGLTTSRLTSLSRHVKFKHNHKEYYDKWIKDIEDDICKICGEKTKFKGFRGYDKCCCKKHKIEFIEKQCNDAIDKKYGSNSEMVKSKKVQDKTKNTKLIRYGDENFVNVAKCKQTKKERYRDENYNNMEKNKETCLKNWGVDTLWKSKIIREKIKIWQIY